MENIFISASRDALLVTVLVSAPPVLAEVRSAFYAMRGRPLTSSFVIGLGGRDIAPGAFKDIVAQAQEEAQQKPTEEYHIFGVRG